MTGLWLASRNAISSFPPLSLCIHLFVYLAYLCICASIHVGVWMGTWAWHALGVSEKNLKCWSLSSTLFKQNLLFYSCTHQVNWRLSFRGCPVSASCLIIGTLELESYATIPWSTVVLAWQTPYPPSCIPSSFISFFTIESFGIECAFINFETFWSPCLCLLGARITGICHCVWLMQL